MASSSRVQSPTKRLLTELQSYQSDPNDALLELGPVDDDELMHWRAVMKGVPGTAYEGTFTAPYLTYPLLHPPQLPHSFTTHPRFTALTTLRRPLGPRHPHPDYLPPRASHHPLHNTHLPPQRRLQNGRDLPRLAQDVVDACIHDYHHDDEHTSVADERRAG